MANDEILTDDYVAEILAKEASDHALRYSSLGMDSSRTNKKPSTMPKPNTNFLQRIIKSTETHNAQVLASETAESQARLKALERVEERRKRRVGAPQDIRNRQMGDIKAILGGRGVGKEAGDSKSTKEATRRERSPKSSSRRHSNRDRDRSLVEDGPRRRRTTEDRESGSEARDSRKHRKRHSRSRSPQERERGTRYRRRSRSPCSGTEAIPPRHSRSSKNSSSNSKDASASSRLKGRRSMHDMIMSDLGKVDKHKRPGQRSATRTTGAGRSQPASRRSGKEADIGPNSDSDPLDDIIGPAPAHPVRMRGRGFQSKSSGIDRRFEADYDPQVDVEMDEDQNNWHDAVETFRDRKKWESTQEQRMREAGFNDEEIKRWKKGGQPDEEDVRWVKAGEKREWDRGKDDGDMEGLLSHDD